MHTKITIATTAILVTVAGILGTFTMSGTAFATTIPDKDDGASGLAPGENKGQEFPGPETFTPGQIIGPDNPSETPGHEGQESGIIGPD